MPYRVKGLHGGSLVVTREVHRGPRCVVVEAVLDGRRERWDVDLGELAECLDLDGAWLDSQRKIWLELNKWR